MKFLTEEQEAMVIAAIQKAEKGTSAEIKVHMDKKCSGDPVAQAVKWFNFLKMHKTELRTGVLIYVATESRKMAIIGDSGINNLVDDGFWDETYNLMKRSFVNGDYTQGLSDAIENVASILAKYFPYQSDDVNELSDDISYGE